MSCDAYERILDMRLKPALQVALLQMVRHAQPSGKVRLSQVELAARCGVTPRALRDHLAALEALGLIESERETVHGRFGERAYTIQPGEHFSAGAGEHSSAGEIAAPEEDFAQPPVVQRATPEEHSSVGPGEHSSAGQKGVSPTPPLPKTTPPPSPPKGGSVPPTGAERPATLIPVDWVPTERHIEIAAEHGYSRREALFIAHRFETHWRNQRGAKGRKKDWLATFRVWVTNEKRWLVQDGAKHWKAPAALAAPIKALRLEEWAEFVGYFDRDGDWPIDIGPAPNKPDFQGPDDLYRGDLEARKAWKKANGLNGFHPEKAKESDLFGGLAL